MKKALSIIVAMLLVAAAGGTSHAVSFGNAGYSQNFDSMGTTGTTPPTGWSVYYYSGSNTTWETSIPASAIGGSTMTASNVTAAMLDTAITSSTKSTSAYNMADSATPNDRALATSPTGIAGTALQLVLTNTTGATLNSLSISYDIDKFYDGNTQGSGPYQEELPGYELFYSVNGGAYVNVASLNPVVTADGVHPVVPVGTPNTGSVDYTVTSITNAPISLTTAWGNGQTLTLQWVDDNAVNLSPDQVIGLNNVNITPTPIPAGIWLLGSSIFGLFGLRKKLQK